MVLTGRCNCGAVRATISGDCVQTRQCWCRQCQKAAAGQATTKAIFPAESVSIEGDLAQWSYTAASGNVLTQSFCAGCGTPVMAKSSARPHLSTIRVGFLDPGHGLTPDVIIWTDEAPSWARFPEGADQYPGQPPAPAAASPSPPHA